MLIEKPTFKAIADHALLVSFSNDFSESVHSLVVALDNSIKSNLTSEQELDDGKHNSASFGVDL